MDLFDHNEQKYERLTPPAVGEGFEVSDKEALQATLSRLLTHIDGDYCVAGGVSAQAHLAQHRAVHLRQFNDIDMVMRRLEDINPEVNTDFMIWHLHPNDAVDGFYVALVDRNNGLKVDVFGWQRFPVERIPASLDGETVYIRSAANALTVLISAMYRRMTNNMPMIPKQLVDAEALLAVARPADLERLWHLQYPDLPLTADDALSLVRDYARQNPERFQQKPANKPKPYTCPDCVNTARYPLTPTEELCALPLIT